MAIIKTIPRGQSLTITYVFPEDYDMSRIVQLETVIGQTVFEHIIEGQTAIVRLKSSDTQPMLGQQQVTLMLEDTLLGVQKPYSGIITIGTSYSKYSSEATSGLSSIVIPIVIDETIITADDVLYNYFRCKSAYELAVEGGYTGTEEEFNEDLAMFRFWSEQAELAAQQTAADAAQTALDRIATGEDRVQTGQDVQTTAADVIQTGQDVQTTAQSVIDAEAARDKAEQWAENPEDVPVEESPDKFSALHWAAKALGIFNNIVSAISGKEDSSNKRSTFQAIPTDIAYPSEKLVKDNLDLKVDKVTGKSLIDDTEITRLATVTNQTLSGLGGEATANKQNSLALDGTGVKFPTVDAVNAANALKADKSTVTQKIYLMLYEVATVVTGVITAVKKLWNEYADRVTADAGTTTSLTNTERIYKMMVDNGMFNYLAFGWAADGGYKSRTSGILTFFTKIYNFFGTNDAAQATALNQPYRFFDGGMKGVGSNFFVQTNQPITLLNRTITIVIQPNMISTSASLIPIIRSSILLNNIQIRYQESNILYTGAGTFLSLGMNPRLRASIGKNMILSLVVMPDRVRVFVDGAFHFERLIETTSSANFNQIYCDGFGNITQYVDVIDRLLSDNEVIAHQTRLSRLYPEIPSVTIGSQTWQLYNNEMVATPRGNVIQEMQAAGNVERITNAADREFASDTGFFSKLGSEPSGVTISSGFCNFNQTTGTGSIIRNLSGMAGKWFKFTFTIVSVSAGGIAPRLAADKSGTFRTTTGTFNEYLLASALAIGYGFLSSSGAVASIDNVSFEEVGWSGSQALYDAIYAQTSGTVAQKTTAALMAAAMWRYPNNDSAIGSWAGKQINKFAAKLMQEDILAFNAANPSTPWGYAVPTRAQLATLAVIGGNAAKVTGTDYWTTANGTNTSGLSLLGTGFIQADGTYTDNKASTLLMCHDADFARKVVNGDNTFDEVAITTEGGVLRFIKV